ncbi:MAG: ribonuclease HI [Elusimicrobia bacterium CG08_land_8_20_14_0_20_59_10]|nr:MAG: ribonuclease HI [Elusimicrobia bacterium CG08_land_8_20_14_0_20_59_10]
MKKEKKLKIFIDGGSRGNPGYGACAAVFFDRAGSVIREEGKYLGRCTNNFAEYNGLRLALAAAALLGAEELAVFSDSELLVRQFSGEYRIKDATLAALMAGIRKAAAAFKKVSVFHVPREKNKEADRLVNSILDNAGNMPPAVDRALAEENAAHDQPELF